MNLWEIVPALAVFCMGAGLYVAVCLRFPPAIILGVTVYSMVTKSASVMYIETVETYLIEVGMVSHMVGATPRQIFYNLFIFIIALAIIRWVIAWKRPQIELWTANFGTPECNRELRVTLVISAILLGVQFMNAVLSPPYAIPGLGVDRQLFWSNIRFPLVGDLIGVLVFFVPAIAGVALAYGKVTNQQYFRRFSILLMLAYGVYFLLTGARFNGPMAALLIWLSSYWIVLWAFDVKLQIKRMALTVILVAGALLAVGYREIADRGISQMTGSAWNGFVYRIFALQGNVSFAADVLTGEGERRPTALLLGDMATTVETYMPSHLGAEYLVKGANLAGSLPGNSTLVFGYWFGLMPMAIYAILLGTIASIYILIVLSGRFLLILPAAYLCLWAYNAEAAGSFANFLDYKLYLFIGLIVISVLIPKGNQQYRRPARASTGKATRI